MTHPSDNISSVIAAALTQHCERVRLRVHQLVEPLTLDQLWQRPYPYGNSVGHLVLHLTGNLSTYIGAGVAGSGYVRDRPREFADDSKRAKADIMAAFDRAVDEATAAAHAQHDDDWGKAFQAVGVDDIKNRMAIFLRCAAHLDHHTGQIIYLCKQLESRNQ